MSMLRPIHRLRAIALPLLRDNIDTDELIPVWENTRLNTVGWGDGLFAAQRYLDGVAHTPDPRFILNQTPFDQAEILIGGANFGSGSSRESAVWALRDYGFQIVIAISFNETFLRNCIVNGLAPLQVSRTDAEQLVAAVQLAPADGVLADLRGRILRHGAWPSERAVTFLLDDFYCDLLTTGRTENDLLSQFQTDIDARRKTLVAVAPWLRSSR
jgi:3-isopropylmalate/(R)-2-methylmalate dehydratase small subunit